MIVAVLFSYGAFFFYKKNQNSQAKLNKVQQSDFSSVDVDRVVNKYLQETTTQMLVDRANARKAEEKELASSTAKLNKAPKPIVAEAPIEQQIYTEKVEKTSASNDLASKVNDEILNQELDKKEYARQFIENARKGGYHVELANDLSVISVTPIRKPSQIDEVDILPSN